MRNDIIPFGIEKLREITGILKRHFNEHNTQPSSILKKFVDEVDVHHRSTKGITHNRAVVLIVDVNSFYFTNRLIMEEQIEEFLNSLVHSLDTQSSLNFLEAAERLRTILIPLKRRRFLDAELLFCNKEALDSIKSLRNEYEKGLRDDYERRYLSLKQIINILNEDSVCFDYKIDYVHKFKQINNSASVGRYHEKHYFSWVNKQKMAFEEYVRVHRPEAHIVNRMKLDLDANLKRAEDEHNYIMQHMNEIDVRIISFPRAKLYPKITISTQKHTNSRHLKNSVENLLWFEPRHARSDKDVDIFIRSAKNPYGDVFYIEK